MPAQFPLVLELPGKDDMSYIHDNGASRLGAFMEQTDIDQLLVQLGDEDDDTQWDDEGDPKRLTQTARSFRRRRNQSFRIQTKVQRGYQRGISRVRRIIDF